MKDQYVLRFALEVVVTEPENTKQVYWRLKMKKKIKMMIMTTFTQKNIFISRFPTDWKKGECFNTSMDAIRFIEIWEELKWLFHLIRAHDAPT